MTRTFHSQLRTRQYLPRDTRSLRAHLYIRNDGGQIHFATWSETLRTSYAGCGYLPREDHHKRAGAAYEGVGAMLSRRWQISRNSCRTLAEPPSNGEFIRIAKGHSLVCCFLPSAFRSLATAAAS